ncbi:SpoIIE family protein phosphatase [Streptomyces sp. NRRL S-118]|uniref:SpoIIE family protein phosphatase n=1 Tax=Streptomyces sp. NRRL S-118 TaxID=1463881 RepID=UPI000AB0B171|nr:SpoIIE family protein phosphatase [Streptomyces sp. NRRL S-118]
MGPLTGEVARPRGAHQPDEALAAVVRRAGASAGGVYLLSGDEPVLHLVVMCGVSALVAGPWRRVPLATVGPVSDAVREDRLVWVGGQDDMARTYPRTAMALPYRFAMAAAPLDGARQCWGALLLLWPASHPPALTHRERGHLTSSARQIGRLLDEGGRRPAIPEEPRLIRLSRTVTGPAQSALAAADLVERLPVGTMALDLEGRVTYVNTAALDLLGRSAGQLLGTLPWQSLPWMDNPVSEDHYRTAVLSREPVAYTVLHPPDRWLDFRLYPDDSGMSVLITPSGAGGREPRTAAAPGTGAALGAGPVPPSPRPAGPGATDGAAGRIHQLLHLAAALTETVGVRDVIDLVADQVMPAFGAQGMVLSTKDAGRLRIAGHRGYQPRAVERLDGLSLDTGLTPAGQVLITGAPQFFNDPTEMARAHPLAPALSGKQAWAFLPLITRGRPVGCLVLSYDHPRPFTAGDRAALTSLAGLIAQALDRARLYDAKHDLAHNLQQALLPHSLPHLDGLEVAARYLPATHGMEIGGDFYDLIRLGDSTAAAVIGDVQGHNATAAALMGQVRTAIHAHATAGANPAEVLSRTDRVLADFNSELFVSCLYAHIDLERRSVRLASAGHPPAILHHPRHHPGGRVLDIEPGPLLGIGLDAPFPITTLPLLPGTLLALYTDGLVETPGTDITQAISRLARRLADIRGTHMEHLIDELIRRTLPTGRHTDDIAVLLLRARDRAG